MLKKIDELMLVAKCSLSDDREAFGILIGKYQSDIKRFFINLTGDAALSDDLAQETFIKAYVGIRSFKGISKFSTWIYRIAYNEFYDYCRKRKEELITEGVPVADSGYEISNDVKMDVWKAVESLGEPERSIVVLFYIEDKSIKDISKITSMPEGTVKSHISRAKSKLVRYLHNN